jgi:hypothetical protein
MSDTAAPSTASAPLPQLVLELKDLVVDYCKQETVVPLRQLGRYLAFGIVGAVLLGIGVVLLGVGALRALQTETGSTFTGDWSWAPYLVVVVTMALGGALTWKTRRGWRDRKEHR